MGVLTQPFFSVVYPYSPNNKAQVPIPSFVLLNAHKNDNLKTMKFWICIFYMIVILLWNVFSFLYKMYLNLFSLEYWFKISLQQIQFEIKCPFKLLHTSD